MRQNLARVANAAAISLSLMGGAALFSPAGAVMITPGNAPGEPNLYTIMNNTYGAGNWTQIDSTAVGYQFGTNAGQTLQVDFSSRFAADTGTFGVFTNQTTWNPLISFVGSTATPPSVLITPSMQSSSLGGTFTYGYRNDTTGDLYSSDQSKNADGIAHLIWFQINNMSDTWVMAWEDEFGGGDHDYQDAILQTYWHVVPTPVPEPATLGLFSLVCLGTALVTRRRNRRT